VKQLTASKKCNYGSCNETRNVMRKYYSLIDKVYALDNLFASFRSVKRNKGAAGIDNQSVKDFEENLVENINKLHEELRSKTYQPSPVRRVEIPRPDAGNALWAYRQSETELCNKLY